MPFDYGFVGIGIPWSIRYADYLSPSLNMLTRYRICQITGY